MGNGVTGDVGGGSHGLKGEWKGDQSSPTEYKWGTGTGDVGGITWY